MTNQNTTVIHSFFCVLTKKSSEATFKTIYKVVLNKLTFWSTLLSDLGEVQDEQILPWSIDLDIGQALVNSQSWWSKFSDHLMSAFSQKGSLIFQSAEKHQRFWSFSTDQAAKKQKVGANLIKTKIVCSKSSYHLQALKKAPLFKGWPLFSKCYQMIKAKKEFLFVTLSKATGDVWSNQTFNSSTYT